MQLHHVVRVYIKPTALLAAIILPLLSTGCGARVAIIGPPLFPPPIIAPGIGVIYYGGNPYYWDGVHYSYWDGHGYRGFQDHGPGYDHHGYGRADDAQVRAGPRPIARRSHDAHHASDRGESHSG